MYEHTNRLLSAAARRLQDAASETASNELRISSAFIAGYNALQAVQPPYSGPLDDHPLAALVTAGAALLGLPDDDLKLGLALRAWEDHGRYLLEPAPVSVTEAMAWAERVRKAAIEHQARSPER